MAPLGGASMQRLLLLCVVLASLAPHAAIAQSDATDPVPALEPDTAVIAARYGEFTSSDYAAASYGYGEYGYGYYGDYGSGIGYGGYGAAAPAPLSAVAAVAQQLAAAAAAEHRHVAHLISADEAAAEEAAAATSVAAALTTTTAPRPAARRLIEAGPAGAAASYIQAAAAIQAVPRAPTCPPCPTCVTNEPRSLFMHHRGAPPAAAGGPGGSCYCRYHSPSGQWALREPSCRAALAAKCGPAGSLLECSALQAFYAAPNDKAGSAAADQISAFLFVDCPPNPPCSCEALRFDGRGAAAAPAAAAARTQCCSDLRAHCRTPFSGLDCEEVESFCASDDTPRQLSATLRQFVAVKTHGRNCAEPQARRAYTRFATDSATVLSDEGAPRPAHGHHSHAVHHSGPLGVSGSTIMFLVGAACVAIGVAVAGTVIALQMTVFRHEAPATAPLLSR